MVPLQIRITENDVHLEASGVPYSLAMLDELELAFLVEVDGHIVAMSPYEFSVHTEDFFNANHSKKNGEFVTGHSGGSGEGFKASSSQHLDLLFTGRRGASSKGVHGDGTLSVEGLNEDGTFKTFKSKTEESLAATWESIGPKPEQYVANFVVAGKLAMGINPITGHVNETQAAKGTTDSKWYSIAHQDTVDIHEKTGIAHDLVVAATTTLSAGRLWSGTKNGNIETARALADIVHHPIELDIQPQHLEMMAFRAAKSAKEVGRIGLVDHGLTPGKISSKDLDASTLVEAMYAINVMRGHPNLADWVAKTSKDGKPGMKSSREQIDIPPPYPYFTSKGTQQVKQAVAVLRGEVTARQAISGPKYSSFYSNIMNPGKDSSSTNDTWHYRIMAGNLPLTYTKNGVTHTKTIVEHSIKDKSPDGVIVTTQDIFQRGVASKSEGLASGDGMFRDTTKLTRTALNELKKSNPDQFQNMKIHEFQALIWVHYGGGQSGDAERTAKWYGALDTMKKLGL